jgi:hypothetical protein
LRTKLQGHIISNSTGFRDDTGCGHHMAPGTGLFFSLFAVDHRPFSSLLQCIMFQVSISVVLLFPRTYAASRFLPITPSLPHLQIRCEMIHGKWRGFKQPGLRLVCRGGALACLKEEN